ncbi:MAG: hypothetical protein O2923_05245 [Verrucomicrobia bacterium]|nr:hypothetical protein [Verrucomicrobiota bacterium]MDA1087118.1 hypothetical protein [Verrucomicrobiota bacterium]
MTGSDIGNTVRIGLVGAGDFPSLSNRIYLNTMADIETFLATLKEALDHV